MTARIVIPQEGPATTPPAPGGTNRRWWFNVAGGVIVIVLIVAVLIAVYASIGSWLKEPTVHIVTYIPGTVDIEPGIDITYNGDVVGKIDSAQVNIAGTQLFLRRGESGPESWDVLTFIAGAADEAYADSIQIMSTPGRIVVGEFSGRDGDRSGAIPLFEIENTPASGSGHIRCFAKFRLSALNGRETPAGDPDISPGDEIEFREGSREYTLRWTAPGLFTRVYGRIAYKQLLARTIVKTDSSRLINSSASVSISNTFGLTKTSARFSPTFEAPLVWHAGEGKGGDGAGAQTSSGNSQLFVEMRPGGNAAPDDIQATLAYLTSRTKLNQPPSNRLENMASNIDMTLAGLKGTVNELQNTSIPAVTSVVRKAGGDVDTLTRSLNEKLAVLQDDINRLTNTANGSIGKLTDSTAATMTSLQLRIDLLLEEIRLTTAQLRKTANGVGADIHNVVK